MQKIILTATLLVTTLVAQAQVQDTLPAHYRRMALEYNHDLKAAEKSISASIELQKSARADRLPQLGGNANFQYKGNPTSLTLNIPSLGEPLSFEGQNMNYGAAVSLMQPIYTGGRVLETIRMAEHRQSYAESEQAAVRSAVCFQTDIQYWNTVARAEIVAVSREFHASISSLTGVIRQRVDGGVTDPQDLLMAEVKLNEAEYRLLQSQSNFETGLMAFNSLIGVDLSSKTRIGTELPTLIESITTPANLATRPEIRMAQENIAIQQSAKRINDSRYKPQLSIGAEGNYSSPGYNFKSDLVPNYGIYAKLSVPIFSWGKRRSDKRAYQYNVDIAQDKLNKTTDAVTLEVSSAQLNLQQAQQQVALTESSLDKAAQNERKALERYNEGAVSIVEVIDAQIYKQTAQINFVQAKLAMQTSYAELLRVQNMYN